EVEPGLTIKWDNRDHIALYAPSVSRAWAIWRTKESEGLVCRFNGKKGQFNLARLDGIAAEAEIGTEQDGCDVLLLTFRDLGPEQAARLKALLTEHVTGFRETLGK